MWEQLLAGTRLVDAVIAITVAEAIALVVYYKVAGRGVAPSEFGLNLLSGLMLMLALRSSVAASGWVWTASFLAGSGAAHAADLWSRWRR